MPYPTPSQALSTVRAAEAAVQQSRPPVHILHEAPGYSQFPVHLVRKLYCVRATTSRRAQSAASSKKSKLSSDNLNNRR